MFSSTAEYALRAVVYLALNHEDLCSSQAIAEATKAPPGYISKILKDLAAARLITSQRGPSGGFSLAKDPETVTVLDVINIVDRFKRIEECPLGLPSHGKTLCRLHKRLDDALAIVEKILAESTIAEMIGPRHVGRNCVFPTIDGAPAGRRSWSRKSKSV